jgi:hypothetical protein
MCFLIGIAIYGYSNGNLDEILAPVDGQGRICGFSPGVESTPYLWVSNKADTLTFTGYLFTSSVCTTSCPTSTTGDGATIGCVNTDWTLANGNCETQNLYPTTDIVNYCALTHDNLTDDEFNQMINAYED